MFRRLSCGCGLDGTTPDCDPSVVVLFVSVVFGIPETRLLRRKPVRSVESDEGASG